MLISVLHTITLSPAYTTVSNMQHQNTFTLLNQNFFPGTKGKFLKQNISYGGRGGGGRGRLSLVVGCENLRAVFGVIVLITGL